jgi:hypothetical protein
MQKIYRCALAVALVALSASYSYAGPGELKLTISSGLVTIVADQVPVSRILSEWARVGQTRIVNGERLMTNVSLEVIDWPERKALDLVLRSASGYMAAERQGPFLSPSASAFDRIMILPFSKGPANTMPVASAPAPFSPRPMPPQPEIDEDQPVATPPPMQQPQTQAMPGMPPAPQNVPGQPQQQVNPNAPTTLPRPGMLPQPGPQQPVVPFGTLPGVPPKPAGGGGGGDSDRS